VYQYKKNGMLWEASYWPSLGKQWGPW
jgi:hypothetical protein